MHIFAEAPDMKGQRAKRMRSQEGESDTKSQSDVCKTVKAYMVFLSTWFLLLSLGNNGLDALSPAPTRRCLESSGCCHAHSNWIQQRIQMSRLTCRAVSLLGNLFTQQIAHALFLPINNHLFLLR